MSNSAVRWRAVVLTAIMVMSAIAIGTGGMAATPDEPVATGAYDIDAIDQISGAIVDDSTAQAASHRSAADTASLESSDDGPIEIATWHDLHNVRDDLDGDYVLVNDLTPQTDGYDTVAASTANDGSGFDPIGEFSDPFSGTFDGDGHEISGLVINRSSQDGVGLFGVLGDGNVTNLHLVDALIVGDWQVGAIAGLNDGGTVQHSSVTGAIVGEVNVGGIIGEQTSEGEVQRVSGAVEVSGDYHIGGLIGNNNNGNVTMSAVDGIVSGIAVVGGLTGDHGDGLLSQSVAHADVNSTHQIGGVTGWNHDTIDRTFATGSVDGDNEVGALVGENFGHVSNSYWDEMATGQSEAIGNETGTVSGALEGLTTDEMTGDGADGHMDTFDFDATWTTTAQYPVLQWMATEDELAEPDAIDVVDTDLESDDLTAEQLEEIAVTADAITDGQLSIQLWNDAPDAGEEIQELANIDGVDAETTFEITVTLDDEEDYRPHVLVGTGEEVDWQLTEDGTTEITVEARPAGASYVLEDAPTFDDWDGEAADIDFELMVDSTLVDMAQLGGPDAAADLDGMWISTDAQLFTIPTYVAGDEEDDGEVTLEIAGPTERADGSANDEGFFHAYLPADLLDSWEVTDPTTELNVSVGETDEFTVTEIDGAAIVELDIEYSVNAVEISPSEPDAAYYEVNIMDTNDPITEGDYLEIDVEVENIGEQTGEQDIHLAINPYIFGATLSDVETNVTIDPEETKAVSFNVSTEDLDVGLHDVLVESENDSASTTVEIQEPDAPFYAVDIAATNDPITAGDNLQVSVDVENVGDLAGAQDIQLAIDAIGVTDAETDVEIDSGQTETILFNVSTNETDGGGHTLVVESANDSATTTVSIDHPPGLIMNVDRDTTHETFAEAIETAEPGDTLEVELGLYDEDVRVDVDGLTIVAQTADRPVIDGGINVTADNVTLAGLIIESGLSEGDGAGAGIHAAGDRTSINELLIEDVDLRGQSVGVSAVDVSTLTVRDVKSTPSAVGIEILGDASVDDTVYLDEVSVEGAGGVNGVISIDAIETVSIVNTSIRDVPGEGVHAFGAEGVLYVQGVAESDTDEVALENVTVDSVEIESYRGVSVLDFGQVALTTATVADIQSHVGAAISGSNVTVVNPNITDVGASALHIDAADVSIDGGTIDGVTDGGGIFISGGSGLSITAPHVEIAGVEITDVEEHGIDLEHVTNASIRVSEIALTNLDGITVDHDGSDAVGVSIDDSDLSDIGETAINVSDIDDLSVTATDIDHSGVGVSSSNVSNVDIEGVVVHEIDSTAIAINGGDMASIRDVAVHHTEIAIELQGPNQVLVEDAHLADGMRGIVHEHLAEEQTTSIEVESTTIERMQDEGVRVWLFDDNFTVRESTIQNTKLGVAIEHHGSVGSATVTGTTIQNTSAVGIFSHGSPNLTVTHSQLLENDVGIELSESVATINQNKIVGNTIGVGDRMFFGSPEPINATHNWWGASDGPSGVGPGSGDEVAVLSEILLDPWLGITDAEHVDVSPFAGVVADERGLEVDLTGMQVGEFDISDANTTIELAGEEFDVTIEDGQLSTTIDTVAEFGPGADTGEFTVAIDQFTVDVQLVHEVYDLDEGYTRWSIPQPAALYTTDGVLDMTQWNTADTSYENVNFGVNDQSLVTAGEDLHQGLYVHADTSHERFGFDYVEAGDAGLPPGGAPSIEPGWNFLGSNYDISTGVETLNLDLHTVTNLPATPADYVGDEAMVAHHPSTFARLGGDRLIAAYDTYWIYLDTGEEAETRAVVTPEYDPIERADRLEPYEVTIELEESDLEVNETEDVTVIATVEHTGDLPGTLDIAAGYKEVGPADGTTITLDPGESADVELTFAADSDRDGESVFVHVEDRETGAEAVDLASVTIHYAE